MRVKTVWIKADAGTWEDKKPRITTALESGADCVLVNKEDIDKVRELGKIRTASYTEDENDADIVVIGRNGEGDGARPLPALARDSRDIKRARSLSEKGITVAGYVIIKNKKYEEYAIELGRACDYLIVIATDWKVIPLENLIANLQKLDVELIAGVQNIEEAKLALETLEHGSDGILLDTSDPSDIKEAIKVRDKLGTERISLRSARITRVRPVGMGDRVCVDTCSLMSLGEGMLVGSQSSGLFLVHSESEESPYVAARPFRVNAGAVHAYIRVGDKTRYLSELGAGDEVLIVNARGETRSAVVGRVKIERRPLMLVEAEVDGVLIKTLLQNAETIKLVSKEGNPISVAELKEGDEVLVYFEEAARHFGVKVEETVIER